MWKLLQISFRSIIKVSYKTNKLKSTNKAKYGIMYTYMNTYMGVEFEHIPSPSSRGKLGA